MEQTYYFTGGVKLTVDGRRLVGPCGGADLTRAEEQTLRSLLNHSTIGSAEEFSRVLSLGSGDRKFSAAYRRASNLRKVLEKVGAESIFPSRQWNFVPYGRGPSALSNLREWLAPSTKPVDILVALGTRNHRPFLPGAGLAQKVTSENLREIFRDWETAQWRMAKDAYRGLATDATFLSEITTTIARHHPTATIRSLPDVEVLAALANGEGTAVIALGMGNVNAVSARVVGFLQDEGICPRPFGSESNFLLGYGGEGLNDCNDSDLGCVAAVERNQRRFLLAAGITAYGTQAANAAVRDLLSSGEGSEVRAILTNRQAAAVLVNAHPRDPEHYKTHGNQSIFLDERRATGIPFPVGGLDDVAYSMVLPPSWTPVSDRMAHS